MPPRSKLGKLLTCFYCGRRSPIRYDGQLQQFDCPKCNATNFLDAVSRIVQARVRKQHDSITDIYNRSMAKSQTLLSPQRPLPRLPPTRAGAIALT